VGPCRWCAGSPGPVSASAMADAGLQRVDHESQGSRTYSGGVRLPVRAVRPVRREAAD